jgi:hypothetical protein
MGETNEEIWAELNLNGVKSRYVLDYENLFGKKTNEGAKVRNFKPNGPPSGGL